MVHPWNSSLPQRLSVDYTLGSKLSSLRKMCRLLTGEPLKPFKPQTSFLSLITTGRKYAIATRGAFCLEVRTFLSQSASQPMPPTIVSTAQLHDAYSGKCSGNQSMVA